MRGRMGSLHAEARGDFVAAGGRRRYLTQSARRTRRLRRGENLTQRPQRLRHGGRGQKRKNPEPRRNTEANTSALREVGLWAEKGERKGFPTYSPARSNDFPEGGTVASVLRRDSVFHNVRRRVRSGPGTPSLCAAGGRRRYLTRSARSARSFGHAENAVPLRGATVSVESVRSVRDHRTRGARCGSATPWLRVRFRALRVRGGIRGAVEQPPSDGYTTPPPAHGRQPHRLRRGIFHSPFSILHSPCFLPPA